MLTTTLNQMSGGSGAPIASFVTAVEVLGDITVNNTTWGAASVPMPTNGWVLRITTNLGTVTSCDPTKVTLTISDFGWATDGTATSRSRIVTGTQRVWKPYPDAPAFTDADQAAGVVEIALDQQLYNDSFTDSTARVYRSIITAMSFGANFINSSALGFLPAITITRSDTKPYPLPIWKCVSQPDQVLGSSGYIDYEWIAAHEWAQQGQQVACLEAWARVGGTDGAVAVGGTMADSIWTSGGTNPRSGGGVTVPNALHAPVYTTRVQGGALTDQSTGTIRSRVKPWIGPAVASIDTVNGLVIGDPGPYSFNLMADMPFLKDVAGTKWSPIYAWVNQDGTGFTDATNGYAGVFTTTADPGSGSSYRDFNEAILAAKRYNSDVTKRTGGTHTDADGLVILLRDVGGSTTLGDGTTAYCITTNAALAVGNLAVNMPITIRAASGRSLACRLSARDRTNTDVAKTNKVLGQKMRLVDLTLDATGAATGSGWCVNINAINGTGAPASQTNVAYTIFQNCDGVANTGGDPVAGYPGVTYDYQTTFQNTFMSFGFPSYAGHAVSIGCLFTAGCQPDFTCTLACYSAKLPPSTHTAHTAGTPGPRASFLINSRIDNNNNLSISIPIDTGSSGAADTYMGTAVIQTLFRNWGTLGTPLIRLSADTDLRAHKNILLQYISTPNMSSNFDFQNTRWNMVYNDSGWWRIDKEVSVKFCAFAKTATKNGYFAAQAASSLATSWSSITFYPQGSIVFDPGTGTATTGQVYQAKQDTPAATLLSNTTYWYSAGVIGAAGTGSQPGRNGTKRWRMGVNCLGNVTGGSVQLTGYSPGDHTVGSGNDWLGELIHPGSSGLTTNATAGVPGGAKKFGYGALLTYFVNDDYVSGTAGAGNYRPNLASDLVNMVPAGLHTMPFDAHGTTRLSDGTGAAGWLEHL